jgi:AP-1 complex subunit beta-1
MEKLEIIIRLASERNVDQVLLELKEYATEVDVDFVRRAVRAIGRCAIKLDKATERCINVLLDLIKTKVSYVVQEAVVVIKDIFRKYPNRYESIIATLCENLEDLDEPDAKASMVWIIGEYAERIDNADELLESFLESFQEETSVVQLQLLTATVKLFLKQPDNTQEMVQKVLNLATEHSDNPDLRDRGYVYWRLLSSDPEAARAVVLSQKPEIGDDTFTLEPSLLDELMQQISTLASIYHKPPESFVMKSIHVSSAAEDEDEEVEVEEEPLSGNGEEETVSYDSSPSKPSTNSLPAPKVNGGNLLDLLDDVAPTPAVQVPQANFGASQNISSNIKKTQIVTPEVGHGVFISAAMVKINGQISLELDIGNTTSTPVQNLAIQLNKNAFGIAPVNPQISLQSAVLNGSVSSYSLALHVNPQMVNPQDSTLNVQAAVKNVATNAVFYFVIPVAMEVLFRNSGAPDVQSFAGAWKAFDESLEVSLVVNDLPTVDIEAIKVKLSAKDVVFVAKRDVPGQVGQVSVYFSATTVTNAAFFVELKFKAGMNVTKVTVKSQNKVQSEMCKSTIAKILSA